MMPHCNTKIRKVQNKNRLWYLQRKLLSLTYDTSYGYRGRDCRSNLYLLPTGEVVYFVAAVVVLLNVEEQAQRHYFGHTDDVKRY